jgi:hypothetical protein
MVETHLCRPNPGRPRALDSLHAGSTTIVLQIWRALDTRAGIALDCLQILVDRVKVVLGYVLQGWPGHHPEAVTVKGWFEAAGGSTGRCAIRVNVIEIGAVTHDVKELFKCVTAFGQPRLVRSQVAGVQVWN